MFADTRIQGGLCFRVVLYWILCQIAMLGTLAFMGFIRGDIGIIQSIAVPAFIVSTLFLPLAIYDIVRFSGRFAGPMVNFKGRLKEANENNERLRVHIRSGDFYREVFDALNEIQKRHEARAIQPSSRLSSSSHQEEPIHA
ncbi:MAG: hypothetical protein ACI87E_004866 [Mariniblastus sp.]|jgi:hypothetical protein